MSKPKFTPGPWHCDKYGQIRSAQGCTRGGCGGDHQFIVAQVRGLAHLRYHLSEDKVIEIIEANEALIAAAPAMYAELERIADALEGTTINEPGTRNGYIWNIRYLLKKARGDINE